MKTSCRFCGGIVDVVPESYQVSPVHCLCIGGHVAICEGCGRSSNFCIDGETALRAMTVNLDEGKGLELAADIVDALTWATKDLPKTVENDSTNKILRRTIARLKEYFDNSGLPELACDVRPGYRVMLHPIIGRPERRGPYEVVDVKHSPRHETLVWLKGIRGAVSAAALSIYVPLEGEERAADDERR